MTSRRVAAAFAVAALALAGCTSSSAGADNGIVIGDGGMVQWDPGKGPTLPVVSGTTIEGTPLDLASFKGDVVVVNLWGAWCGPCQKEAPTLAAVADRSRASHFVGVDVRDSGDRTKAQAFQTKYGIRYPSLDDADGSLSLAMRTVLVGAGSPPQTLVVGRDGRLVGRIAQTAEKSVLVTLLQQAGRHRHRVSEHLLERRPVVSAPSTVVSGPLVLAVPVAVAAGLLSFASPCVLPLVPGYLSYVTGLSGEDLAERRRGRVLLGRAAVRARVHRRVRRRRARCSAASAGVLLASTRTCSQRVLGVLTDRDRAGLRRRASRRLQREWRLHRPSAPRARGAPLLGALFGLGWTPCLGPTLGAGAHRSPSRDGSAAAVRCSPPLYCLGLGVPFIAAGLAYRRALGTFTCVRRALAPGDARSVGPCSSWSGCCW